MHSNLSEELLSGGPEPKSFSYTASRRRFEIETMPKRKAAEHEFHQDYSFPSAETEATASLWYAVLARQTDMKKWLPTCEQIAFNLGEQWVSLDSIRGADEVTMKAVKDTAFTDMTPKLRPQMVLKRVLEQLQQGIHSQQCFRLTVGRSCLSRLWWQVCPLQELLVQTIVQTGAMARGRRQPTTPLREFHANMANKYGDVALEGIEMFVSNPDREAVSALRSDTVRTGLWLACGKFSCTANLWHRSALTSCACLQEVACILDETWALISDKADAIRLYGKNPIAGKGYNSEFRKVLSRKFLEVTSFSNTLHLLQPAGSGYKLRVHLQPSHNHLNCV